jgi:hypothetical protein
MHSDKPKAQEKHDAMRCHKLGTCTSKLTVVLPAAAAAGQAALLRGPTVIVLDDHRIGASSCNTDVLIAYTQP